ncbi:MAG: PAS domain S-box protein [Bdellovibrionia bacterium]
MAQPSIDIELANIKYALDSSAIVAITDSAGIITHVNDKFCEISKYSRSELLGQNHRIINSGYHDKEFFKNLWGTIKKGLKWQGELKNKAKDGTYYWVQTVIVPFLDSQGQITHFVSIRFDITDRKKMEEDITQTNQNLQSLIDGSFEGLLIYDLSGTVKWSNSVAEMSIGHSDQVVVGQNIESLLGKNYQSFTTGFQTFTAVIAEQSRILEVATKKYNFQNHSAYLLSLRDITERITLEAQVLQQDRLASVGMLASGLAHEVGTPLGIMRGRAEMLGFDSQASESAKASAQIIIQQIDRVSHLIRNLLKLARGQDVEQTQAVHVVSLFQDVQDFVCHELRKQNVSLLLELPTELEVQAVYTSAFQVVLNLLVNAMHAIQDKRQQTPDFVGEIRVHAEDRGPFWEIHICDNGTGIKEENLPKLFTPFFTTKDVGKGTGLGLATSYKILQGWGGFLSVNSEYGQGACFVMHFKK